MSEADWVLNGVYAVYVVAPLLKNELWLRILLTAAAVGFVLWGSMIDNGSVIIWNSLFGAISIFAIVRLIHQRRSIQLSEELTRIKSHLLPTVSNRDFLAFWGLGTVRDTEAPLTTEGSQVEELMLILDGEVSVKRGDKEIARLGAMDIVGEMSFVTGEAASATVVPVGSVRVHCWSRSELDMLGDLQPRLVEPLLTGINRDMAEKMRRANSR